MDEKKLLFGVLTKTLNKSEQEVTDLLYQKAEDSDELTLKEGSLDECLNMDVSRVKTIQANVKPDKKLLEDQYSRGKKESLSDFEKEVKEKYSLETEMQGIELVEAIVKSQVKSKPKLTDDDVKKHDLYLALEKDRVPKEDHERLKTEFDQFKQNQDKAENFREIEKSVILTLDKLKPILSDNPEVRQTRQDDFLSKFEKFDYQIGDNGDPLVLEDGKRKEDKHGNPIKFEDFVKEIASLNYDFKVQDDKGNSGNETETTTTTNFKVPETEAEYATMIQNEPDPDKRIKIADAWEAKKK